MRVYVPSALARLAQVLEAGEVAAEVAYAVTPALREWYVEGDQEELEYSAMMAAARASLRLLADDPAAPSRRVVLAADIADGSARPVGRLDEDDRAAVRLASPIPLGDVVSAHVDDHAAEPDVRAAAGALAAADAGDDDARFLVDGVEDHELAWFSVQELNALVELET